MPYELPPLPYDYDALAPTIDEQTMRIHHDKHHQAYVDNLNKAVEGHRSRRDPDRGARPAAGSAAGGPSHRGPQQRRRPRQPLAVLADHEARRWRRPVRRARRCDRVGLRERRRAPGPAERRRREAVRVRLGVARRERQLTRGDVDPEPGQPADGRIDTDPRHRRLGARLLPELPEPAPRLSRRVVERRQLGRGRPRFDEAA